MTSWNCFVDDTNTLLYRCWTWIFRLCELSGSAPGTVIHSGFQPREPYVEIPVRYRSAPGSLQMPRAPVTVSSEIRCRHSSMPSSHDSLRNVIRISRRPKNAPISQNETRRLSVGFRSPEIPLSRRAKTRRGEVLGTKHLLNVCCDTVAEPGVRENVTRKGGPLRLTLREGLRTQP